MSIPATITAELASLQAQVTAASPLTSASAATIKALQLNAAQLVSDVEAALIAPANMLDTYVAPSDPPTIIMGVEALLLAAQAQSGLALMRGVVGRAASNLNQLV